ncbi:MAG: hypothetical protein MZW92_53380 [Comamonadaceae bacterium]|nr:hypothetical protein [Comamonadaceae bacterium]
MPAVSLATLLALAVPGLASAGDLRLTFLNGRVTLVAQDVPSLQILAEWERVGGTSVVNRDAAPGVSVTLDLADVPETRALAILLQQAAGALRERAQRSRRTSSRFTRIVIMPGSESPAAAPPAPAGGQPSVTMAGSRVSPRPQVLQRVMPDGRVVSVLENPARPVETPDAEEEEEIPELPVVEAPADRASPLTPGAAPVPASADEIPILPPAAPASGGKRR